MLKCYASEFDNQNYVNGHIKCMPLFVQSNCILGV